MRFKIKEHEPLSPFQAKRIEWQKWFAWYPVKVGKEDWRWLEIVLRRTNLWLIYDEVFKEHFYRPLRTKTKGK